MKTLRTKAEMTQEQLAGLMQRLGFVGWKRITVAEIESFKRRLALEEMVGIAIVYGVTVSALLSAFDEDEALELNEQRLITLAQARSLVAGTAFGEQWFGIRIAGPDDTAADMVRAECDLGPLDDIAHVWANAVTTNSNVALPRLPKPTKEDDQS
jgi:transcriptional regulator with XRE-family HTH domain